MDWTSGSWTHVMRLGSKYECILVTFSVSLFFAYMYIVVNLSHSSQKLAYKFKFDIFDFK